MLSLGGVIVLTILVWGVVLPRASSTPRFQQSMQNLEERGLAPDALFWTEHPRAFR